MMKVCYSELDGPEGLSCRLEAAGHAGFAPAGQDIVCAGASTLMQALVYLLAGEENAHADGSALRRIAENIEVFQIDAHPRVGQREDRHDDERDVRSEQIFQTVTHADRVVGEVLHALQVITLLGIGKTFVLLAHPFQRPGEVAQLAEEIGLAVTRAHGNDHRHRHARQRSMDARIIEKSPHHEGRDQ